MSQMKQNNFKVLNEVEAVHLRPEILLGTTEVIKKSFLIYNPKTEEYDSIEFDYSEGFFRLFEEAVTNSIDEFDRNKSVSSIRIEIGDDFIKIRDNGGGYPLHKYKFEGKEKYAPEWILTKLNSGVNFEDIDRNTVGMNGVGISLVNFLSKKFILRTKNKKSLRYVQIFRDYSKKKTEPKFNGKVSDHQFDGTEIIFYPDFELFRLDKSILKDYIPLMEEYFRKLSMVYPKIKFYFNKKRIKTSQKQTIKALINGNIIYKEITDSATIAFGLRRDESGQDFFMINSKPIESWTSFDMPFTYNLFNNIREKLNKKYKLKISRNTWLNENITRVGIFKGLNVKFKNQTKDILARFDSSDYLSFASKENIERIARAFINNQKFVEAYLEFHASKDNLEAKKKLKKIKKQFIDKLIEATSKDPEEKILIITEGNCLEENTEVLVLNHNKLFNKKIKEINIGDIVLTHKKRFKKVINKVARKKRGFLVKLKNGEQFIASSDHKMYVFNSLKKEFEFKKIKDLNLDYDKLVKHNELL